jgi:hypothetical protein
MVAIASDNFNRANSSSLGSNWVANTTLTNFWTISSNAAFPNSPTGAANSDAESYYDGGITWPNDQYSKAALSATGGTTDDGAGPGLIVRHVGSATTRTWYRAVMQKAATTNVVVAKYFNSSGYTEIIQATVTWSDGDIWELDAQGSTLTLLHSGSSVGTTTDSTNTSGFPGIGFSTSITSGSLDNWEAGDFTVAQDTPELYGRPYGAHGSFQLEQLIAI